MNINRVELDALPEDEAKNMIDEIAVIICSGMSNKGKLIVIENIMENKGLIK